MKDKRILTWISITERGFVCPKCRQIRYIKFSNSIIVAKDDDDAVPKIKFSMNCQFCGNRFTKYADDGFEAAIADKLAILENKGYRIANSREDDDGTTMIEFCDELPEEAIAFLSSAWAIKRNSSNHFTIIECSGNDLVERMESLALWVDKLPERWKICPPKKFKSLM